MVLLNAMKKYGWDGVEEENVMQWSFTGALFYSIVVITTIGMSWEIMLQTNYLDLAPSYYNLCVMAVRAV